jgi:hypothetical protein
MVAMYDLSLNPEIAKRVDSARLPKNYQEAKKVLAACERLDECAAWGDKAAALASYARQANDLEFENYARRIRARAVRRCGELLGKFDARGGDRRSKTESPPTFDRPSRAVVAQEAGLTQHKARAAVRVAAIPEAEFEQAVESARPPGTTTLSQWGRTNRENTDTAVIVPADVYRQKEARRAIEGIRSFGESVRVSGVDCILEVLSAQDDAEMLRQLRLDLNEAVRLSVALDKDGLGNPKVRPISRPDA